MSKPYKIKRSSKVYRGRNRRSSPLTVILTILGCAVLAFVGWSLYQPIYDLVTGNISSSQPEISESTSQLSETTSASESESVVPPVEETTAEKRWMYLPYATMIDEAQLDAFLQNAANQGVNGVLMDLKDANGYLLYQSKVTEAVEAGAVARGAVDLPTVIAKLQEKNMTPVARIYTWEDHVAPRKYLDMAVKYNGNDGYLWLDDTVENGGEPWLNPYSAQAQKYITDLSLELAGMGVKEIVLDGFYFPTMAGSNLASYGETANTVTKDACLKNFISTLTTTLEPQGTELALYVTSTPLLTTDNAGYGGVNPMTLGAKEVLVNAMPASFGSQMTIGEQTIAAPVKTPYESLTLATAEIKKILPEGTNLIMFVQAYTDEGLAADVNKTYTMEDISQQIQALSEQGEEDYFIFSPTGTLPTA